MEVQDNCSPRYLEICDCSYTNDGKICSVKPNHVSPEAAKESPSRSGNVVYTHANVPALNYANQPSSTNENNNSETQMKV